jgi:prepilin-type N-terminal cleavage/methylation domain-containing protein
MSSKSRVAWERGGFTLIEIIGVVALVALLAAILAPRVTSVIGRGKVNSTAHSLASLKTATENYLAEKSSLPYRYGVGENNGTEKDGRFDADLVAGGFTEKLFTCPLGDQTFDESALQKRIHIRSVPVSSDSKTVAVPDAENGGTFFDLDRNPSTIEMVTPNMVVSAFIPGVSLADAIALNKAIDGETNPAKGGDNVGRCLYSEPDGEYKVTVYVYISHH